jgi:imidazolonepropionase-like amidohydrolase
MIQSRTPRLTRCVILSTALALQGFATYAEETHTEAYALTGARLITVSGPVLENATLVMRDGVITDIGTSVAIPPGVRAIDAKGLTLTPGLIDGFSELGLPTPTRRGATPGVTPSVAPSPPSPAADLAPQAFALDKVKLAEALKARDSGLTTALVIPREGVLPGRSVLVNLSGRKTEDMVLRQPAALHLHMNELTQRYPNSLMGTVALARQALHDARRYSDEWAAYEKSPGGKKRPRYDPALAAWQGVVAGREILIVTATRANDIRRALLIADEFKVKVAVAGAPQSARLASLVKERKLPLLVSVNFDPPRPATFGAQDDEQEKKDIEEAERNPAELDKAGVPFALVSAGAPSFGAGILKAIEKGLPREVALRAVTLRAAEALGVADRLGSLEKGKIANVVAWSGEPLTKEAKAKMVFVDGSLYEPDEKPERKKDDEKSAEPVL